MPIPDYQTLMLPLLQLAGDGAEHTTRESIERLAATFALTDEERAEMLPSGTAPLFDNRVGWAKSYLKQAGLIVAPRRGVFAISPAGQALLERRISKIDATVLEAYPEFRAFRSRRRDSDSANPSERDRDPELNSTETPEDVLASAYGKLRKTLENELLDSIKESSPAFFERLVVDLLVKMGYGGSRSDAGKALGKSGDGGIDGIIKEDRLGLDAIYLQAKRWEGTVGRPEIQKFAGALQGQRANKGVFITTSSFTREAIEYAQIINTKIVLIDGNYLTSLMIDHNVGVSTAGTYEIKRIDSDYFDGA